MSYTFNARSGSTALTFNGVTSSVSIGNDATLGFSDFSIACWFKPLQTGSANSILLIKGTYSNLRNYSLEYTTSNKVQLVITSGSSGSASVTSVTTLTTGSWYNVCGTFVSSTRTLSIYINGVLDNTATSTFIPNTNTLSLIMGAITTLFPSTGLFPDTSQFPESTATRLISGSMFNVQLWNVALSTSQISGLYNNNIPKQNMIAQWRFNEGTGSTTVDTGVTRIGLADHA